MPSLASALKPGPPRLCSFDAVCSRSSRTGINSAWSAIARKAGHDGVSFVGLETYPDSLTYDLVFAASEYLDVPVADLLHAFGVHWTKYSASQGYGHVFEMTGETFEEFLASLDDMHARIALTMPELEPPSFQFEELEDGRAHLHYFSDRPGLAPMVCGLVEGLAERFAIEIAVEHLEAESAESDHDVFEIRRAA